MYASRDVDKICIATTVYVPVKKPFSITYVEWKFHFGNVIKPTFGKHTLEPSFNDTLN